MIKRKYTAHSFLIISLCMVFFSACGNAQSSEPDTPIQPISSTSYISSIPYDPSDIHPLEDADAMLLQSVNADGNLFSVTGMVGWYDAAAEEFTPLSGDIFSLPLSDDAFHAYFWKPVFDGAASFRMQYDGADSSFNEYYQAALEQGLFEPPVRSFTSNLQGEVTSLYQEKRLNSAPSATDSFSLELSAQEADLSNAPDIVL